MNLADSCQAILRECIAAKDADPEEAVHLLRVATKRLRAAWVFPKLAVGGKFSRARKKSLRELSAWLSTDRDHAVLLGLVGEMACRFPESGFDLMVDFLERQKDESDEKVHSDKVDAAIAQEMEAWERVLFPTREDERRAMRRCIRRSKNKARRMTRIALTDTGADVWHDWRKAVKRLRYQRELLAGIQGRKPGRIDGRISRLGTRLGQRNDLANLTALAERMKQSNDLNSGEYGAIRREIAADEKAIISHCRRLGRLVLLS